MQDDRARKRKETGCAGVKLHNDDRGGIAPFGKRLADPVAGLVAAIPDDARLCDLLVKKDAVTRAGRAIGGCRYAVRDAIFPAFDLAAILFGRAGIDLDRVVGRGQNAVGAAPIAGQGRSLAERLDQIGLGFRRFKLNF